MAVKPGKLCSGEGRCFILLAIKRVMDHGAGGRRGQARHHWGTLGLRAFLWFLQYTLQNVGCLIIRM